MCEFCDNHLNGIPAINNSEDFTSYLRLDVDRKELFTYTFIINPDGTNDGHPRFFIVNFCPICGREL